jgi:hypothetical protein
MSKVQNRRWGPCPFCKAEGWETVAQRIGGLFDHDRPQGGRCLQAANRVSPAPRFDGRCGVCNSNGHKTEDCPPKGSPS